MKLVLFDIDGTLLLTDGAGRRAIHRALLEVFGSGAAADHRFDGKTDPQIVRELMRLAGHGDDHIDGRMAALLDRYMGYLHEELADPAHPARVFPGVLPLLDALDGRDDAVVGLLTGNLADGARAKLGAAGIDATRFRVGAYGSDGEHRGDLPAIAQSRAEALLGQAVRGTDVVVIGDTPADVRCGRGIGARAIAVATGSYSAQDLAVSGADAVFESLEETAAVLGAIFQ